MPIPCRAVLGGTALLSVALALAACDAAYTSMGQGMAESSARANAQRYAAQGNPQFAEPALQAVVKDFEARYAEIGLDSEKLGMAQGKPCPATKETAFQVLKGMSYADYRKMLDDVAAKVPSYTGATDLNAVQLVSLSGVCGETGPEGPAVVAGTTRDVTRYASDSNTTVTVSDTVSRIEGTWIDGQRSGSYTWILITRSAQFKPDDDGALEVDVNDWAYVNEMREPPTATYLYFVAGEGGKMKYTVTFSRNPVVGIYTTAVAERIDDVHAYSRSWQGTELWQEGRTKNGMPHGWQTIHPTVYNGTQIPGQRNCYQNGELIKALECPST
jgi:hypothetical protein